ncbi:39S ribosomal protein L33, mitochondrial [Acomys russatus]|nr:39S ribosomal protein L33, mitochondrial [Acomys russatus]
MVRDSLALSHRGTEDNRLFLWKENMKEIDLTLYSATSAAAAAAGPAAWSRGVTVAKSKSKTILVKLVSQAGTGFSFNHKRSRLREKLSLLHYDPIVNKKVLFVEQKKIRSL